MKKKYFTIHDVDTYRELFKTDDPIELVHWLNDESVNIELHEMWVAYDGKFHGAEFLKEKFAERKRMDAAAKYNKDKNNEKRKKEIEMAGQTREGGQPEFTVRSQDTSTG